MSQPSSSTAPQRRKSFAEERADRLAVQVGTAVDARLALSSTRSARFVWYRDDETLTLVVGEHEGSDVDSALAVGLGERGNRTLRLVLPHGWHEATLHRWAWLRDDLPLTVWSHDGKTPNLQKRLSRSQTEDLVRGDEQPVLHLGERTSWVESLMRWAGEQDHLDAAHRPNVRAWQCRGQRVLRISRAGSGLQLVPGIDWGANSQHQTPARFDLTGPVTSTQEADIKHLVLDGIKERLGGVAHKADEHWLQAVLRRHPRALGLEQPVLRELAAWRPRGSLTHTAGPAATQSNASALSPRGRGFIDLVGLDASGDLLLVETKLGGDHMLVLQGLDYRIWAEANRERLTSRLDCRPKVPFEISYCVGGKGGGAPSWSPYTAAHFAALAKDVRWHIQEVTDWTSDHPQARRGRSRQFPFE